MFDKIICINLKNRKDKYNNVKNIFDKLHIDVDFYFAEKHNISGRIGCFESHINVIKNCYYNNNNFILIFEDDIVDTSSYNEKNIQYIVDFMKENKWCEYFQLGYSILPHEIYDYVVSKDLKYNSLQSIIQYNGNTAHAYILNRSGMKRILMDWENAVYTKELDLDVYYKSLFKYNGASSCPILFDQNFCINNDNDKATTSYYKAMRSISCLQFEYSLLYFFSLFRFYLKLIIFFIIIIILIIFFQKNKLFFLIPQKDILSIVLLYIKRLYIYWKKIIYRQ